MSNQFLYFLPGRAAANQRVLAELGLDDRLDLNAMHSRGVMQNGPDKGAGVIIAHEALDPERVGYWPEKQTWRRAGDLWIGFEAECPPGPEDLVRDDPGIRGIPVKLGDGREWIVPPGNRRSEQPWLPYRRDLQDDGSHAIAIVEQYQPYIDAVDTAFEKLVEADADLNVFSQLMTDDQTWALAYAALAIAYRVSKWEIDTLRLLNTTVVGNVVIGALDYREFVKMIEAKNRAEAEAQKKTPPDETDALDTLPIAHGATG